MISTVYVYLSRIIGNKILGPDKNVVGVLKDLAIDGNAASPKVVAAKVNVNGKIKFLNWDSFNISEKNNGYRIVCNSQVEVDTTDLMLLNKNIMDRQIIDVNGRKVVRANDIRLALLPSGFCAVAVDIGMEGILRRLGLAKFLKSLGVNISSRLMMWNEMETVYKPNADIQISKSSTKLSTLHPSDLADIIEDFDSNTGMFIFSQLDTATAADVLEELEEDAQVNVVKSMSVDQVADILEEMPADEVADILDGLSEEHKEQLLSSMEKEASDEVRELLEYEDNEVGSLMVTEYVEFNRNLTVQSVIEKLRELKPEEDEIHALYVTDAQKLVGIVTLRDLIISQPNQNLGEIMEDKPLYIVDTDEIDELIEMISKYNLFSLPVVDKDMNLVGNAVINDVVYDLLKNSRKIRR